MSSPVIFTSIRHKYSAHTSQSVHQAQGDRSVESTNYPARDRPKDKTRHLKGIANEHEQKERHARQPPFDNAQDSGSYGGGIIERLVA